MKVYFTEEIDKSLLEAKTEDEVREILKDAPEGEKLADRIDLVMKELKNIKGELDEEVDLDELDHAAGGAKRTDIYLSETTSCHDTFYLEDLVNRDLFVGSHYCGSGDFCNFCNEFSYHYTKWSNCKRGGKHVWYTENKEGKAFQCCKNCGLSLDSPNQSLYNFNK